MSRHTYSSTNHTPDYELRCDECGMQFDCGDDSFYSWPVLCSAAEAEGWRMGARPAPHLCTECLTKPAERSAAWIGERGRLVTP